MEFLTDYELNELLSTNEGIQQFLEDTSFKVHEHLELKQFVSELDDYSAAVA